MGALYNGPLFLYIVRRLMKESGKQCILQTKTNILKKINYKELALPLLISLFFFGFFAKMNYATDTYAVIDSDPGDILQNFLASGRLITAFCFSVFKAVNAPISLAYSLSFATSIISMTLAIYLLAIFLGKIFPKFNKKLILLIATTILVNPFSIELFLYIEKGIMVASLLFCVLGVIAYDNYLEERKKKNLLSTLILVFIAVCCYQGTIGLFITLATIAILSKKTNTKNFIKLTTLSVFIYGASALANIFLAKILSSGGRVSGSIDLIASIEKILAGTEGMIKFYGIMPWLLIFIGLAACVVVGIYTTKKKKKTTAIFNIAWITLVIFCAAIAPQLVQNTESIWMVARSTYIFASIAPLVITILLLTNKNRIYYSCSYIFLTGLLIVQYFSFSNIIIDHYAMNSLDIQRALIVNAKILEYEDETGKTVETIISSHDATPTYAYQGRFVSGDINISAFNTSWSDVVIINLYSNNRSFKRGNDVEFENKCKGNNYNEDDGVILEIKDNTAYLCNY